LSQYEGSVARTWSEKQEKTWKGVFFRRIFASSIRQKAKINIVLTVYKIKGYDNDEEFGQDDVHEHPDRRYFHFRFHSLQ
jgi:hypothetical protein